ncbi:MAG: low molecular weight protein arginine phosphatase [Verrucomicrobiota bacterium]
MGERNQITVICTANICRSPMAEKLLAHALKAQEPPLSQLVVQSAGVSAYGGEPASANAVKALQKVGLDLSQHESQAVTKDMVERSFAIFCMTQTHRMMLDMSFPDKLPPHVYLLRELMADTADHEIPDPYGRDLAAYESSRDSMVEAIPSIIDFLKSEFKSNT